jgi:hypothetical protein
VALQGTPALFSSHRVLGFFAAACEERERGTVSLKTTLFCFFSFYFICGVPINGLQQVYCEKLRSGTKNQALPENTYNYNFQSMKRIAQIDKAY